MIKLFIFSVLIFSGCGITIPTNIEPTQYYSCLPSVNNFSTCCAGHSGAQTCSAGYYFRSSDKALVCVDGTVDLTCFQ